MEAIKRAKSKTEKKDPKVDAYKKKVVVFPVYYCRLRSIVCNTTR